MSVYHKRTWIDWLVLGVVIVLAGFVIALSFSNTMKLAETLHINPYLAGGMVEILFATLLFIRGRQRATKRNVPIFLDVLYYISLGLVTAVNMWGLFASNAIWGLIIGVAISFFMWGMEYTLVWLWTKSHEPHKKSVRELKREANREIKEEKVIQRIEWMKWAAGKPDLKLIQEARAEEEERKKVVGDGLPEFFTRSEESPQKVVLEPVVQESEPAEVIPIRPIGFHVEPKSKQLFQPNMEARARALETAKELKAELGRMPKKRELIEHGLTDHYAKFAMKELQGE